jgi:hypothetical protein
MHKRLHLLGLFLLIAILPTVAFAQTTITLPEVEVDLWPEYDDPGVLVIYRITLPSTASLPAQFILRIPAAAGGPNAVAARQPDGSLVNLNYQQTTNGVWNELAITATSPEVQVEYYDPNLQKDGQRRTFSYQWPADYAVDALTVQVQQPVDASQMQFSPDDFGPGATMGDGLVYYTENIGGVPVGSPVNIQIGYNKSSDLPTVKQTSPTLSPPSPANQSATSKLLPWALGLLGLGLIVGGIVWYLRSNNEPGTKTRTRQRRRSTAKKDAAVADSEGFIYCPQCGTRAVGGDRFCRTCGAELRR